MEHISKISRIALKDVWRYEDRDLTPWLTDHIDVIGDALGMQLTNAEREQSAGSFSVDIKAEDIDGDFVVIENQYGSTDHDHLGKLITYLSSFGAKTAVWIVENPRTEHVNAINWLNEGSNDCNFFLLKLEAIKIEDSPPAPLITKIVGPSEEVKKLGKVKKEDAERHRQRFDFWEKLLQYSKSQGLSSFNSISPVKDTWISATAGVKGLSYAFWVNQFSTRLELRIDRGKGSEEENLKILNKLKEKKMEIESVFGSELLWADMEGYRVCSVRKDLDTGGYRSEEVKITESIKEMVELMKKLQTATKSHIKEFK